MKHKAASLTAASILAVALINHAPAHAGKEGANLVDHGRVGPLELVVAAVDPPFGARIRRAADLVFGAVG